MSRGNSKIKKQRINPDEKYGSFLVAKFINHVMVNGKKTVAQRIVYEAFDEANKKIKAEPIDIFNLALKNVSPILEVKSKRIGGANYQVPVEVSRDRKNTLAMRWILEAARSSKGKKMSQRLAIELVSAYNNDGAAIKKRQDTHKMAEANKAFAHFARF